MVSYDVCGLFADIPIHECIDLTVDKTLKYHQALIKETFCFYYILKSFSFQKWNLWSNRCSSYGITLRSCLANLFMGFYKNKSLNTEENSTVLFL